MQLTEREGSDVKEQDVRDVTREDTTLNGSTNGDSLVRVDTLAGLATEHGLDGLDNTGHTGHATDEDDLVDLTCLHTRIGERLLARVDGALDKSRHQALELRTEDLDVDVLGTGRVGSDEGQVDLGLRGRRELDLRLLSSFADTLERNRILSESETALLLELIEDVLNKDIVEVLTTEVSVTVRGLDLEDTLLHLQDRDIEGSASQIVDSDDRVVRAVKTVGQRSGGRLVDDTKNIETSNGTSILGRLPLRVVEVRGDSDDSVAGDDMSEIRCNYAYQYLLDLLAEVLLSSFPHLCEDH